MTRKQITQKDIARMAGVSPQVVSAVLTGGSEGVRFSETTRQKVVEIATEHNYRPNRMARALKNQNSQTIGVLAEASTHTLPEGLLNHLIRRAGAERWMVACELFSAQQESLPMMIEENTADVLLIFSHDPAGRVVSEAARRRIPHIVVNPPGSAVPGIELDDAQGTRLLVDQLCAAGCDHIALWSHQPEASHSKVRLQAFEHELIKRGQVPLFVTPSESLHAAMTSLLTDHPETQAVILDDPEQVQALHGVLDELGCEPDHLIMGTFPSAAGVKPVGMQTVEVDCRPHDLAEHLLKCAIDLSSRPVYAASPEEESTTQRWAYSVRGGGANRSVPSEALVPLI